MENLAINSKLEIQVANTPAGPEKEHLIKLIEDRVDEVKDKVGKRKTDLAARLSGKQETSEATLEGEPKPKKARDEQSGDDIATLREELARVSNIETRCTTHLDTTSLTDRSSSGHTLRGSRGRG